MTDFQALVRKIRSRGKSLTWIATRCGCSKAAIAMLDAGRNAEPRYHLGKALVDLEKRTRPRRKS